MDRPRRRVTQGLAALAGLGTLSPACAGDSARIGFASTRTVPLASVGTRRPARAISVRAAVAGASA